MKPDYISIEKAKPRGFVIGATWHNPYRRENFVALDIPEMLATVESLTSPKPARAARD